MRDPYTQGFSEFKSLGYEDGFEGYCCDSSMVPSLYAEHIGGKWNQEGKAYKAGAFAGYKVGWKNGYDAAIANELWLYNTVWQMRTDPPVAPPVPQGVPWREEFEAGPEPKPMYIPFHMRNPT